MFVVCDKGVALQLYFLDHCKALRRCSLPTRLMFMVFKASPLNDIALSLIAC